MHYAYKTISNLFNYGDSNATGDHLNQAKKNIDAAQKEFRSTQYVSVEQLLKASEDQFHFLRNQKIKWSDDKAFYADSGKFFGVVGLFRNAGAFVARLFSPTTREEYRQAHQKIAEHIGTMYGTQAKEHYNEIFAHRITWGRPITIEALRNITQAYQKSHEDLNPGINRESEVDGESEKKLIFLQDKTNAKKLFNFNHKIVRCENNTRNTIRSFLYGKLIARWFYTAKAPAGDKNVQRPFSAARIDGAQALRKRHNDWEKNKQEGLKSAFIQSNKIDLK
jgi:hypothetical protein